MMTTETPKAKRRDIAPKREAMLRDDYTTLCDVLRKLGQGVRVAEFEAVSGLPEKRVRDALGYAQDLGFLADLGEAGWVTGDEAERRGLVLTKESTGRRRCRYFTKVEAERRGLEMF